MKVQRNLNNGNSTLRVVGSSILIERSCGSLEIFESRTSVLKKTKKEGIVGVSNYIQFYLISEVDYLEWLHSSTLKVIELYIKQVNFMICKLYFIKAIF